MPACSCVRLYLKNQLQVFHVGLLSLDELMDVTLSLPLLRGHGVQRHQVSTPYERAHTHADERTGRRTHAGMIAQTRQGHKHVQQTLSCQSRVRCLRNHHTHVSMLKSPLYYKFCDILFTVNAQIRVRHVVVAVHEHTRQC